MAVHQLWRAEARRIAVRAQLLDGHRPAGLLDTVRHLTMAVRGEVAIAGRDGPERLWDLAERVYPADPAVPADEALRVRAERRLRALGIARPGRPETQVEPMDVSQAGEPAQVEGVRKVFATMARKAGSAPLASGATGTRISHAATASASETTVESATARAARAGVGVAATVNAPISPYR